MGNDNDLVFDLGFHLGEDTEFYLKTSKRVVAVEASPELVQKGKNKFKRYIENKKLTIIQAAIISDERWTEETWIDFYPNLINTEWGSVDSRWITRNQDIHGVMHSLPVKVKTVSLPELVRLYGNPGFVKIDIEGCDEEILFDIGKLDCLPRYLSWETGKESFMAVVRQHRYLQFLGYRRFKLVQQAFIECKQPFLLSSGENWVWPQRCSGASPEYSKTNWKNCDLVVFQYFFLFLIYQLIGPGSFFRKAAKSKYYIIRMIPDLILTKSHSMRIAFPGWYDSHAKLY